MGLCETSSFSIFTFINASDLKFYPRSYSSGVYHMMKFKNSNGKICKMMTSHLELCHTTRTAIALLTIGTSIKIHDYIHLICMAFSLKLCATFSILFIIVACISMF